jgi:hypothetical protein
MFEIKFKRRECEKSDGKLGGVRNERNWKERN